MGLFGVLVVSFVGVFGLVCGSTCIPETARCSKYWTKIEPHRNLMKTEKELNAWCRQQYLFYDCLEEVLLDGKKGNLSHLPVNLLISKMFAHDLCTDGSSTRRRLLNNAACINNLNTEYCTLPEYLDIVTPDSDVPPSECSLAERTFSCMAATMVSNCGLDSGRVYSSMLKITRYSEEVCNIEASKGIPTCEKLDTKGFRRNERLSGIYYGLVHRIGNIPEQDEDFAESSDGQTKSREDYATGAIQAALDLLDGDGVYDYGADHRSLVSTSSNLPKRQSRQYETHMENPIITEVYNGIFFYNYSDHQYSVYWRQSEISRVKQVKCTHNLPDYQPAVIFTCGTLFRTEEPDCPLDSEDYENLTPELIRELDPEVSDNSNTEIGPRPEWMSSVDYAFNEKKLRDAMSTTPSGITDVPDNLTVPVNESDNWNFEHSIFPRDFLEGLIDLYIPKPERHFVPKYLAGKNIYMSAYYNQLTRVIQNVTCSLLDECHQNGKGVWRCKAFPRDIEVCENCTESDIFVVMDSSLLEQETPTKEARAIHNRGHARTPQGFDIEMNDDGSKFEHKDELDYKVDVDNLERDIKLLILDSVINSNENLNYEHELQYAIDNIRVGGNEENAEMSTNEDYGIQRENLAVLEAIPDDANLEDLYTIV